jgi:hypothetical protein
MQKGWPWKQPKPGARALVIPAIHVPASEIAALQTSLSNAFFMVQGLALKSIIKLIQTGES